MEKHEMKDLLQKYINGECTPEEANRIEGWYNDVARKESGTPYNESIFVENLAGLQLIDQLSEEAHGGQSPSGRLISWPARIATIAAAIVVLFGVGTLIFNRDQNKLPADYANDVEAGTNKATLTLPNGKVIDLNDAKDGELASDHGVKIIKQADGQLLYQFNADAVQALSPVQKNSVVALALSDGTKSASLSGINSLSTPKGGQYHIALPDGTNVWLNAGSTLKFPSTFQDLPERIVVLSGEAYFEVSSIKSIFGREKRARKMPFIVKTATQEVTVLGTHFNINSYADEPNTKTTLLEGSVRVVNAPQFENPSANRSGQSTILKPGLESVITRDDPKVFVQKIDTEQAIAWKNGEFMFRKESLESIMRKVARWYDVEIIYENNQVGKQIFGGTISRYKKISEVLCMLELTGDVHFKIEGRRVTVN